MTYLPTQKSDVIYECSLKENEAKLAEKDGEIASANHNFKAAIARRKAATQTRLASEGKDPEPKKVGKKNPI